MKLVRTWEPIRQQFKRGDTVVDRHYQISPVRFFMPKIRYRQVGIRNYLGSVEGEYLGTFKGKPFHQYQSILRNCRMLLIEKTIREL